ncbi:MAG: hypothetical protein VKJ06_07350 [Vampirovibrionales bacterium]|nr:hypothetical protein [Vampirovibrionales bacterium]
MISAQNHSNQRWYDAYPDLQKSLVILAAFPPQILEIVAEGVVEMAERECRANDIIKNLRTLGKDKILALHKSKHKRRFYDVNPQLHKAMNYIFVLSENNRLYMAKKMMELIDFVFDYLKACSSVQHVPCRDEIGNLASVYVRKGGAEAREFLEAVRQNFADTGFVLPGAAAKTNNAFKVNSGDMRISQAG